MTRIKIFSAQVSAQHRATTKLHNKRTLPKEVTLPHS